MGAMGDRLWFALDRLPPAWDQADYLNGVLNYWRILQTPEWLDGQWWKSFWLLSSKIPPLIYIATVPFVNLFGTSADAATLVMLPVSAILLLSVYGLGVALFNVNVGLWAAGLCQVLPGLYRYRTEFLLDYPLTAAVTASFYLLTLWKIKRNSPRSWLLAAAWGISFGLALMVKQTALFFLFLPILWALADTLRHRRWQRFAQLAGGIFLAILVCFPWYRTNWLLIFTSGKRATIDSAIAEGDPALNTLDAWIYYLKILPFLLSWIWLLVPIVGLLMYGIRKRNFSLPITQQTWLAVFLLGGYFLASLNINKDARYILPLLPVLSLILTVGLLCWKWQVRWGTLGLAVLLMGLNLFPIGGLALTQLLSPRVQHHAYLGPPWFHEEVVQTIVETAPYLRSTLGVLPSTPEINQHNFSFYGGQQNFQVVGRQVGVREAEVEQDARSLDWFITKTGDQGSVPAAQAKIVERVEHSFNLQKSWQLPDRSILKLYHRPSQVTVQPVSGTSRRVRLQQIRVPDAAPPGSPIPVTYQWSGSWAQLQSGLVLLTWHRASDSFWLHDHGIGMGALQSSRVDDANATFTVRERTAMLPGHAVPGIYTLKATYLNRDTGEIYAVAIPPITLTIDPTVSATPAPELDLVTQLRAIAPRLAEGTAGLEPIFAQTARINQYDPLQDYLAQAEQALTYRRQQEQPPLDWLWAIALANVLQQDVDGAIATLQQIIRLDSQNPYTYAYLAFVYLYDWQPRAAQAALKPALSINPDLPELQTLSGIAALMQGNLIEAWRNLSPLID